MNRYDIKKYVYLLMNHFVLIISLYVANVVLKQLIATTRWYINAIAIVMYIVWIYFCFKKNEEMKKRITKINSLFGIFIIGLFCIYNVSIFNKLIVENGAESLLKSYGGFGKAIYFIICFLQPIILPLPEPITITAGNVVFGKMIGFVLGFLGTILGVSTMFYIFRGANKLTKLNIVNSKNIEKYNKLVKKNETLILVLLFIVPILPDEVICMGAGLSLIRFEKFLFIAMFSKFITIGIYTISSTFVRDILEMNFTYQILIVLLIICVVMAFKTVIKYIENRKKTS